MRLNDRGEQGTTGTSEVPRLVRPGQGRSDNVKAVGFTWQLSLGIECMELMSLR